MTGIPTGGSVFSPFMNPGAMRGGPSDILEALFRVLQAGGDTTKWEDPRRYDPVIWGQQKQLNKIYDQAVNSAQINPYQDILSTIGPMLGMTEQQQKDFQNNPWVKMIDQVIPPEMRHAIAGFKDQRGHAGLAFRDMMEMNMYQQRDDSGRYVVQNREYMDSYAQNYRRQYDEQFARGEFTPTYKEVQEIQGLMRYSGEMDYKSFDQLIEETKGATGQDLRQKQAAIGEALRRTVGDGQYGDLTTETSRRAMESVRLQLSSDKDINLDQLDDLTGKNAIEEGFKKLNEIFETANKEISDLNTEIADLEDKRAKGTATESDKAMLSELQAQRGQTMIEAVTDESNIDKLIAAIEKSGVDKDLANKIATAIVNKGLNDPTSGVAAADRQATAITQYSKTDREIKTYLAKMGFNDATPTQISQMAQQFSPGTSMATNSTIRNEVMNNLKEYLKVVTNIPGLSDQERMGITNQFTEAFQGTALSSQADRYAANAAGHAAGMFSTNPNWIASGAGRGQSTAADVMMGRNALMARSAGSNINNMVGVLMQTGHLTDDKIEKFNKGESTGNKDVDAFLTRLNSGEMITGFDFAELGTKIGIDGDTLTAAMRNEQNNADQVARSKVAQNFVFDLANTQNEADLGRTLLMNGMADQREVFDRTAAAFEFERKWFQEEKDINNADAAVNLRNKLEEAAGPEAKRKVLESVKGNARLEEYVRGMGLEGLSDNELVKRSLDLTAGGRIRMAAGPTPTLTQQALNASYHQGIIPAEIAFDETNADIEASAAFRKQLYGEENKTGAWSGTADDVERVNKLVEQLTSESSTMTAEQKYAHMRELEIYTKDAQLTAVDKLVQKEDESDKDFEARKKLQEEYTKTDENGKSSVESLKERITKEVSTARTNVENERTKKEEKLKESELTSTAATVLQEEQRDTKEKLVGKTDIKLDEKTIENIKLTEAEQAQIDNSKGRITKKDIALQRAVKDEENREKALNDLKKQLAQQGIEEIDSDGIVYEGSASSEIAQRIDGTGTNITATESAAVTARYDAAKAARVKRQREAAKEKQVDKATATEATSTKESTTNKTTTKESKSESDTTSATTAVSSVITNIASSLVTLVTESLKSNKTDNVDITATSVNVSTSKASTKETDTSKQSVVGRMISGISEKFRTKVESVEEVAMSSAEPQILEERKAEENKSVAMSDSTAEKEVNINASNVNINGVINIDRERATYPDLS